MLCRENGICNTVIVKKIIYDTGLNILRMHADTAYLVDYWAVYGTQSFLE